MDPTAPHADAAQFLSAAVARHQTPLLRYAARLVGDPDRARDIVQDTFVRLMAQTPSTVADHLAEWLFTVCRNRALDFLRKEGRMIPFADGEVEQVRAEDPRPGRALELAETQAALREMIERLPANQQEVIRLKFQHGFSYKEISRITTLSVSNVGFLIHTAVSRMRRDFAAQRP